MEKDVEGYIVVETVGAFVPFVLLIVAILSLVNIVTLQARIHYALTQTAGMLSMYSYAAHAVGVADELSAADGLASSFGDNVGNVLDGINSLADIGGTVSDIASDPEGLVRGMANYGIGELREMASAAFIEPIFRRYLTAGDITADEYFRRLRVVDFELVDCVIIDANDNVRLTAEYEIEYTFGMIRLPSAPTIRISQTVVTKAWLGGSGRGYEG